MRSDLVGWGNLVLALVVGLPAVIVAAWGFSGTTPKRRAAGVGGAVMLGGVVFAAAMAFVISARVKAIRAGWNLLPVVVAADDITPGTVLTFDMVSQRPIPEQFVVDALIRPDQISPYIGKKVMGHLHAGDPLTRASMGEGLDPHACDLNPR